VEQPVRACIRAELRAEQPERNAQQGLKTRMVQLVDGDDIDLKTGKITYAIPFDRPYDWRKSGDERLFGDMVTPAGLAENQDLCRRHRGLEAIYRPSEGSHG